jgi:hypothetical protein
MQTEFRAIVHGASNRLATEYGLISRAEPLLAPKTLPLQPAHHPHVGVRCTVVCRSCNDNCIFWNPCGLSALTRVIAIPELIPKRKNGILEQAGTKLKAATASALLSRHF